MRLDFNVLWVDDQPNRVDSQIRAIARQMAEEGFQFNATPCQSVDDVRGRIADDVFTDEIDLILVDWDLGGGVEGQDAIAVIRESVPYKDVVFYSAQTPASTLRQLAFEKGIEGVYCATREELVAEVLGVFESLVKKVLDLDHTRGIVMGATSDIDDMVNKCLLAIQSALDEEGKQDMLKQAREQVDKRIAELSALSDELKNATTIADLFKAHFIFTANDRLRMLSRFLKTDRFKAHAGSRKSVITYMEQVVPKRNKLGHRVLVPGGKPQVLATSEGDEISLAETRELRVIILTIRADFETLLAALQELVS